MPDVVVLAGGASPDLAAEICRVLRCRLYAIDVVRFANDCLSVRVPEECRDSDVFVVQAVAPPVQENLTELLLTLDAARNAGAARVTAVLPHYAYARSDKKDLPGISIAGRLFADLLVDAGARRVVALGLHAPQVEGFFRVPVEHVQGVGVLAEHLARRDLTRTVVVSPDVGGLTAASRLATLLGVPVSACHKQRLADGRPVIALSAGTDLSGADVVLLDDEIVGGSTVLAALDHVLAEGAATVRVACTHGLFVGDVLRRLQGRSEVVEIISTDSVAISPEKRVPKLTVVSVAAVLARSIDLLRSGPVGQEEAPPAAVR